MTITESELLAELAAMGPKSAPPDAMTSAEMAEALGIGRSTIKDRLAMLRAEGRLETWTVHRVDGTGRKCAVPAYTIKPKRKR